MQTTSTTWTPPVDSGLRGWLVAVALGLGVCLPVLGLGGWHILGNQRNASDERRIALAQIEAASHAYEDLIASAPAGTLPAIDAAAGRDLFASSCAVCHSPTGAGIKGLGKNLIESDFVAAQTDQQLHDFLIVGRPNAQPMPMPPKGGRADLTDEDMRHLVVYLRGMQDPRRMPELSAPAPVASAPTQAQTDAALAAAGGDAELAQYIANGSKLFSTACVACHGPGGVGVAGNGKRLVKNDFIKSLDDDALLAFITQGRSPTDPKNTTGIQMPPKGGNPALSEDDILDIISYLRTLQDAPTTTSASK